MKVLSFFLFLLGSAGLFSGTEHWIGGSGNRSWDLNTRWSPNITPDAPDEVAILDQNPGFPVTVTLSALVDRTVGKIQFNSTVPYTIKASSSEVLVFSVTSGSALIELINSGVGSAHSIQIPIRLDSPLIVTNNLVNPPIFTISKDISETGTQSLTKEGTETLLLSGTMNSYSGGTYINQGTLSIGSDSNLGALSGGLFIKHGTLVVTGDITSARSGSFTGSGSIDTGVHSVVLKGSFDGTGSLTKLGGGTLTLSGNNSFVGPISVSAGTVQGNTQSLVGNIAVTGSVIFNQDSQGVYSGSLSGGGSFTKNGSGRLEMVGDSSTFSGMTTVSSGELKVNGSMQSSSFDVAGSAVLSGNGPFGPVTVQSGGTFAPGNSITTSVVFGNFIYMPGSNYNVDISPTASDLTIITGNATLTGAHIILVPEPGFYGFSHSYTIIQSASLLGTTFADVTSPDLNFQPFLSYTGSDVILTIQVPNPFKGFSFTSKNAESVAINLVALNGAGQLSGDLLNATNALVGLSVAGVDEALDQLHPAAMSGWVELQTENGAQLVSLFHRLPALSCDCEKSWRFWAIPSGSGMYVKNGDGHLGFDAASGGIAIGSDRELFDQFYVGIGAAWNRAHLKWKKNRGSSDINTVYGALYADYGYQDFYLGGALLPGIDFCDTSRHISYTTIDRKAKSDFRALDMVGQLRSAYYFRFDDASLYPYGNLDFIYLDAGKVVESGAGALDLSIEGRKALTLRTELGFTIEGKGKIVGEEGCWAPRCSLGWVYMNPIIREKFHSKFEGSEISFISRGWDRIWNLIKLDLGIKLSYRCFALDLSYNAEISADGEGRFFDQHGSASFNWQW